MTAIDNAVLSPASAAKFLVVKEAAVEQMRLLKRYDIRKVGLSSDIIGSPATLADQNIELVVRTEVWSPYEVLLQATSINAELMALSGALNPYTDGPLGVITAGAYADILLVDGNPLEDITILRDYESNIGLIMKDGVIYKNTLTP